MRQTGKCSFAASFAFSCVSEDWRDVALEKKRWRGREGKDRKIGDWGLEIGRGGGNVRQEKEDGEGGGEEKKLRVTIDE